MLWPSEDQLQQRGEGGEGVSPFAALSFKTLSDHPFEVSKVE